MMTKTECIQQIEARLTDALHPTHLLIEDESHQHIGHKSAPAGSGHYRVEIAAPGFAGLSRLEQHRLVYDALGNLMQREIHALKIIVTP